MADIKPIVVIPLYHTDLSKWEDVSLWQCLSVLRRHPICLLTPNSLKVPSFLASKSNIQIISLEDHHFLSASTYNQLLKSRFFYVTFSAYTHILIYQLDAFVFYDNLIKWCNENYSYVGAPWVEAPYIYNPLGRFSAILARYRILKYFIRPKPVGNGGFSLRRVADFLKCLDKLNIDQDISPINEDQFWGQNMSSKFPFFKVPNLKTAALFSIELKPSKAMAANGGFLPFGCHNWSRRDILFWLPYIKMYC